MENEEKLNEIIEETEILIIQILMVIFMKEID